MFISYIYRLIGRHHTTLVNIKYYYLQSFQSKSPSEQITQEVIYTVLYLSYVNMYKGPSRQP